MAVSPVGDSAQNVSASTLASPTTGSETYYSLQSSERDVSQYVDAGGGDATDTRPDDMVVSPVNVLPAANTLPFDDPSLFMGVPPIPEAVPAAPAVPSALISDPVSFPGILNDAVAAEVAQMERGGKRSPVMTMDSLGQEPGCVVNEFHNEKEQMEEQPKAHSDNQIEGNPLTQRRAENREEMCFYSCGDDDDGGEHDDDDNDDDGEEDYDGGGGDVAQTDSSLEREFKMSVAYYETFGYPNLEKDEERDDRTDASGVDDDDDDDESMFRRHVRKVQSCPNIMSPGVPTSGSEDVSRDEEDHDDDGHHDNNDHDDDGHDNDDGHGDEDENNASVTANGTVILDDSSAAVDYAMNTTTLMMNVRNMLREPVSFDGLPDLLDLERLSSRLKRMKAAGPRGAGAATASSTSGVKVENTATLGHDVLADDLLMSDTDGDMSLAMM